MLDNTKRTILVIGMGTTPVLPTNFIFSWKMRTDNTYHVRRNNAR